MLIYLWIILLLIIGIKNYDLSKSHKRSKGFFFVVLISMILVTGLQHEWGGGDFYSYGIYYKDYYALDKLNAEDIVIGSKKQPLWVILVAFIKSINPSYEFFIFCHSIIINTVYLFFIRKNTKYVYTTIAIFFFTMNYFMVNLELQRESLAVCFFLIALESLKKEQILFYYLWTVVAFLFHISAFFMLFFPILYLLVKRAESKKVFIFVIILMTLVTYLPLLFKMQNFVEIEAIQGTMDQANYYASLESNFSNTLKLSIFESVAYFILLYLYLKNKMAKNIFLLALIMEALIVFGNSFVPGLYRIGNYMMIPIYITIANMTHTTTKKYSSLMIIFYIFFTVSSLYNITRPAPYVGSDKYRYNMWIPYQSIFDNNINLFN